MRTKGSNQNRFMRYHRSVSEPHRLQIHTPSQSKTFHAAASSSSADLRRSTATAARSKGFITDKNSAPLMLHLAYALSLSIYIYVYVYVYKYICVSIDLQLKIQILLRNLIH
ncbi:hypothetical protein LOK49_LG01G00211 [Camellia lanceoleosa]|uniref:Uncharacterized protein n=1 Tax=Camellia lanceoleosa TaxID=1840588 RepID=A0ACC0J083_9ERIC|nr:hypothetical protein LOK49_LG01G00211 [Camellia lanceoleosa]